MTTRVHWNSVWLQKLVKSCFILQYGCILKDMLNISNDPRSVLYLRLFVNLWFTEIERLRFWLREKTYKIKYCYFETVYYNSYFYCNISLSVYSYLYTNSYYSSFFTLSSRKGHCLMIENHKADCSLRPHS